MSNEPPEEDEDPKDEEDLRLEPETDDATDPLLLSYQSVVSAPRPLAQE